MQELAMRLISRLVLFAILACVSPVSANFASFMVSGSVGVIQGNALVGVGYTDTPNMFMNAFRVFQSIRYLASDPPSKFDINGYPIAALTNVVAGVVVINPGTGFTDAGTSWTLKWQATRPITVDLSVGINVTSCGTATTCTVGSIGGQAFSGGGSAGGCTATDPYFGGNNWCIVKFNFVSYPAGASSFEVYWPSGVNNYASGTGQLYLVRGSDEACLAGVGTSCPSKVFTPEAVTLQKGQLPNPIRTMGLTNVNYGNVAPQWAYRTTPNALSYFNQVYPPTVWAGSGGAINCTGSGSTCSSDAFTAAANADFPTLVDGTVVQGIANFNSAGSSATLNYAGSGAIPVLGISAVFGTPIFQGPGTFIYVKLLNTWLYASGGISPQVPIEDRVELANNVNGDLWDTTPQLATVSWLTSEANVAFANLNSNLNYIVEDDDEDWNPDYIPYYYFTKMGNAMGWSASGNANIYSFQSLRMIFIHNGILASNWGSSSRAQVVAAWQEAAFVTGSVNSYLLQSSLLDVNAYPTLCTYLGYTYTGSCSTNPNYNASPNRTGDVSKVFSYASYYNGVAYGGGCYSISSCSQNISPSNIALLQSMATNYLAGGVGIATAKAQLDADVRYGSLYAQTVATFSGSTITLANVSSFTASVTNGLMTVIGSVTGAALSAGQFLVASGFPPGADYISSLGTGTGGAGTYNLSCNMCSIGSQIFVTNTLANTLTVTVSSTGTLPSPLQANTAYITLNSGVGGTANVSLATLAAPTTPLTLSGGSGTLSLNLFGDNSCSSRMASATLLDMTTNTTFCFQAMMTSNSWVQPIKSYEGGFSNSPPTTLDCRNLGLTNTKTATVTFNTSSPTVTWTANGLHNGDRFSFTTTGSTAGTSLSQEPNQYFVTNVGTNSFDISTTYYNPVAVTSNPVPTGTITGYACMGLDNLLDAYKNDATYGYNIAFSGHAQFTGKDATANNFGLVPNNKEPALLATSGYSQWSSCGAQIPNADCFQLYNGYAAYSLSP